jgi:hypothetical protein
LKLKKEILSPIKHLLLSLWCILLTLLLFELTFDGVLSPPPPTTIHNYQPPPAINTTINLFKADPNLSTYPTLPRCPNKTNARRSRLNKTKNTTRNKKNAPSAANP